MRELEINEIKFVLGKTSLLLQGNCDMTSDSFSIYIKYIYDDDKRGATLNN